jgi:hypothetical protein
MKTWFVAVMVACALVCSSTILAAPPTADEVDVILDQARGMARKGDLLGAITICNKTIQTKPDRISDLKLKDMIVLLKKESANRGRQAAERAGRDAYNAEMNRPRSKEEQRSEIEQAKLIVQSQIRKIESDEEAVKRLWITDQIPAFEYTRRREILRQQKLKLQDNRDNIYSR